MSLLTWAACISPFSERTAYADSTEEIRSFLASNPRWELLVEKVADAISRQDLDFIKLVYRDNHGSAIILQQLEKLPPSLFKSQAVLMLMRESWYYDDDENGRPMQGSRGYPHELALCVETLRGYFPKDIFDIDDPKTKSQFNSRKTRELLAIRFEAALAALPSEKKADSPTIQVPEADAFPAEPEVRPVRPSYLLWALSLGAMAFLGVCWWFVHWGRKRKPSADP